MNKNSFLPNNKPRITLYIIWGLIASSILSCFSRPDYNIICGFLVLFLRNKNNGNKSIRCGIQLLVFSIIFDLIWIIKYTSFWRHGEETSELWQSLSLTHNLAYFLGFLEMFFKIPLAIIYFKNFKRLEGRNSELLNFRYSK